jgi:hypothetical protein
MMDIVYALIISSLVNGGWNNTLVAHMLTIQECHESGQIWLKEGPKNYWEWGGNGSNPNKTYACLPIKRPTRG